MSHAPTVTLLRSLVGLDIVYYSDTQHPPSSELTPFTRISRLLVLLESVRRMDVTVAILLGRGMGDAPREAIERCATRAGMAWMDGADIVADQIHAVERRGAVCIVGDSCLSVARLTHEFPDRECLEIPCARIAPLFSGDEPLSTILQSWNKSVGTFVVAARDAAALQKQITTKAPEAAIVDEHEHLALALAERMRASASPRLRVLVTERTERVVRELATSFDVDPGAIAQLNVLESAPTEGPFAISLDADGTLLSP